jgi:glycerol uptake facilitator-like aquaporin
MEKKMKMSNRLAAEFIGTFWLVLGGCGSAVLAAAFPGVGIGLLGVAFAFGLTVLTNDTRQADRKSISRQTIEDAAGAV